MSYAFKHLTCIAISVYFKSGIGKSGIVRHSI